MVSSRKKHNVVVLERPGYGWSEQTNRERTVENIVVEDRKALSLAGFSPPYILAAHSIGGFEANAYAASYPDEVAGVILIDSLSPGAWLELHTPHTQGLVSRLFPLIRPTGVLRFIGTFFPDYIEKSSQGRANNYLFVDPSLKEMDKIHIMHNYMNRMTLKEGELSRTNAQTVQNLGFPSNVHLESIIAFAPKDIPNYTQILQLQNAWVSQSAKGELHKLEGEHSIYHYYPDEVCEIIEKVFNDLKK